MRPLAAQVYNVVADVDRYSEFLPFCKAAAVVKRLSPTAMECTMEIGFNVFTERYGSRVELEHNRRIKARARRDPAMLRRAVVCALMRPYGCCCARAGNGHPLEPVQVPRQ